jgi:hypothetical protein
MSGYRYYFTGYIKTSYCQLLVFLVITLQTASAFAVPNNYLEVPEFAQNRFGLGYDTASQGPTATGQTCIDFSPEKDESEAGGTSDGVFEEKITHTSISDILKLSIITQLKTLDSTYEAKGKLDVAQKTQTNKFSEAKIYYAYDKLAPIFLKPEEIFLKPEFKKLFAGDTLEKDDFRAKCGDAFVIGFQKASYYLGTFYKNTEKTEVTSSIVASGEFNYKGSVIFDLKTEFSHEETETYKEELERVGYSSTMKDFDRPSSLEEIALQYKSFRGKNEEAKVINVIVAPYSVAKNADVVGLLSVVKEKEKLQILLNSLWALKALDQEAGHILSNEEKFALGLSEDKRDTNKKFIQSLKSRWRTERESLVEDIKKCIKKFGNYCDILANWYDENPRIIERKYLPKQYKSICKGRLTVSEKKEPGEDDTSRENFKIHNLARGDHEMNGNRVRVSALLEVIPRERDLTMEIKMSLEESSSKPSVFTGIGKARLFTLTPSSIDAITGSNVLEECEYAQPPINTIPISGKAYGKVEDISGRHARDYKTFEGEGLISQIECIVDTPGDEKNELFCKYPELHPFQVRLVNRLDIEAEQKLQPSLEPARSLKSIRDDFFRKHIDRKMVGSDWVVGKSGATGAGAGKSGATGAGAGKSGAYIHKGTYQSKGMGLGYKVNRWTNE